MTVKITKPQINIREELNDLKKPTGIAGEAMLRAETPQEQFNLIGAGRKNLIINGDLRVSQRGDYSSAGTVANANYFVDRFRVFYTGVSATVQRTNNSPPNTHTGHSLKVTATSSAQGYIDLLQYVEYQPFFVGKHMTLSAWVRSNNTDTQFRVTAGSQIATKNHSGGGEWEYLTLTFVYPTTVTTNIGIEIIAYDNGTVPITNGDFVEIANLQLELGDVATPFEHRSYGEELALCQRYYQKFFDEPSATAQVQLIGITSGVGHFSWWPPVQMRARPTVGITDTSPYWESTPWFAVGTSLTISSISNGHMGRSGGEIAVYGTYSPALVRGTNYSMTGEVLYWDAEL